MDRLIRNKHQRFTDIERAKGTTCLWQQAVDLKVMHVELPGARPAIPVRCRLAEGYMLFLVRRPLAAHPAWVDGRPAAIGAMQAGQFLLHDLRSLRSAMVPGDLHCIAIYVSGKALRQFQAEHDLPAHGMLDAPDHVIHEDDVIRHLGEALLPASQQKADCIELHLAPLSMALLSRLTALHGAQNAPGALAPPRQGGLAAWQERTAKEMLLAQLDGRIGLAELAAQCRLSRSHFARAFKVSTGSTPLRWLERQRLERVKRSLESTDWGLEQIAVSCGFSDASHLARVFLRETGLRPGAWRRLRRA